MPSIDFTTTEGNGYSCHCCSVSSNRELALYFDTYEDLKSQLKTIIIVGDSHETESAMFDPVVGCDEGLADIINSTIDEWFSEEIIIQNQIAQCKDKRGKLTNREKELKRQIAENALVTELANVQQELTDINYRLEGLYLT